MADIETEREMSRAEVAVYLHEFADKLGGDGTGEETSWEQATEGESTTSEEEADSAEAFVSEESDAPGKSGESSGKVTFTVGNESATVNPPETVRFEILVDSTAGMLESSASQTVEFALHWDTEATEEDDDTLDIQ